MKRRISPLREFLHKESSSGLLLIIAAIVGMILANSPLSDQYFGFLAWGFEIDFGLLYLKLTSLKIINYALMTIFFFVVGLEIKRELTTGHLASKKKAIMPFVAALGGMVLPAGIYLAIAGGEAPEGWAIPVATDIALAVGLLAFMGTQVTASLRAFLLALAVIDDIAAILIIALVYSSGVSISWIFAAAVMIGMIYLAQYAGITSYLIYIFIGVLLWYALYRTGVHPTLAGVILGLLTPATPKLDADFEDIDDQSVSVVEYLEEKIHPWSSFLVIPIFAMANTGVVITEESISAAANSLVAWGIFAGLVIGKPLGIVIASLAAAKAKISDLPEGAPLNKLFATGSAAGIGFTVALFIADLAFDDGEIQDIAVVAVIVGSVISALASILLFKLPVKKLAPKKK
jgi:NhaA family Na+:H+ antiporter